MATKSLSPVSLKAGTITGAQKTAVLCMTLGRETAALITQRLAPEEIEAISLEIARIERVPPEITEQVLREWLETVRAAELLAGGGEEFAMELLEHAFGSQKAGYIFKRIQAQLSDDANLQNLRKVDPEQLASILRNEHPQTIALVLTHLDPSQTAQVLKEFGGELGSAVVYRMAVMEKVAPEMLQFIERSVGGEIEMNFSQGMSASGGPHTVAAVLNLIPPSLEKELLESLAGRDPGICEEVKNLMFVFEDIVVLDERAMQRLLREIDTKDLALALKSASEELRTKIKAGMSMRAVEALAEQMEFLGPQRVRDVELAQMTIVAKVRQLEDAGEIVINSGADDEIIQ